MIATKEKLYNLDLLRASAILLVLYFHLTQMFFGHLISDKALYNLGKYGVNVFFVLSGYLVGSIYYKRDKIDTFTFWLRRLVRTYPPYIIMFFISWAGVYFTRNEPFNISYIFMVQNFLDQIPFYLVSWSLCVEEHFYLLFTLGVFFIKNQDYQIKLWFLLALIPLILRITISNPHSPTFGIGTVGSYLQFDSIIYGVIASYYVHKKNFKLITPRYLILIPTTTLIVISYLLVRYNSVMVFSFGMTLLNINILFILLILVFQKTYSISKNSFIKFNSKIAYSIYLAHPIIIHLSIMILNKFKIVSIPLSIIIGVSLTYGISYIYFLAIEKPTLLIKDKYFSLR